MSTNYISQITVRNESLNVRVNDLYLDGTIISLANTDARPVFSVVFNHSTAPTENQTKLMSRNVRVLGAKVIMTSNGVSVNDTVEVRNGLNAITNAMSIGSPALSGTVVRDGTMNTAHWDITAGNNLAVQFYGDIGSSATCYCIVDLMIV